MTITVFRQRKCLFYPLISGLKKFPIEKETPMTNKIKQKGFTLIELMIVIAIIGVLAAIALPIYQDYIVKAQITRVFYEVSSTRSAVEDIIGNGNTPTSKPNQDGKSDGEGGTYEYLGIGLDDGTTQSNLISEIADIDFVTQGTLKITAKFSNNAYKGIQGLTLTMTRQPDKWVCTVNTKGVSSWKDKYLPTGCTTEA